MVYPVRSKVKHEDTWQTMLNDMANPLLLTFPMPHVLQRPQGLVGTEGRPYMTLSSINFLESRT